MKERSTRRRSSGQRDTGSMEQVEGLLRLASELQGLLVPVQPAPGARRRLHDQLVAEAERRYPGRSARLFQQYRSLILITAAAVGSLASIAGVIAALVLRHRHARSTHAA